MLRILMGITLTSILMLIVFLRMIKTKRDIFKKLKLPHLLSHLLGLTRMTSTIVALLIADLPSKVTLALDMAQSRHQVEKLAA